MRTLILKCPSCKQNMKAQPQGSDLSNKSKRCVYCGKSFRILKNIVGRA